MSYIPYDDSAEKVVSSAVIRTCPLQLLRRCRATASVCSPFRGEALLLVSGNYLLRCMQEAWEKGRVKTFKSQEKLRHALEQEKDNIVQAKMRLLAKHKKGVVEGVMSPKMKL